VKDQDFARAYDNAYAAVMHGVHAEPGNPSSATGLTRDEVIAFAAEFFEMAGVNYLASWRKPVESNGAPAGQA
jgi:hypothetical protein